MPSSHTWKRNDTVPISGTLKSPNAAGVLQEQDIEGATLRFHMFKSDNTQVVDAAADNNQVGDGSDGTKGDWSYSPAAADTDESGTFNGEIEVTYSDGTIETFPNRGYFKIHIGDDLA